MATTTAFENSAVQNPDWTPYAEGEQFLDDVAAQSGRIYLRTVGTSVQGKPLRMAAVGYPDPPTDADLRNKSVVFISGLVHGDEPSGREASFQKLRDMAFSTDPSVQDYLSKHPVIFLPTLNADSIGTARYNANNVDLNRQYISYSEPEAEAAGVIFRDYQPDIAIDCHQDNVDPAAQGNLDWPLNDEVDTGVVTVTETLHDVLKSAIVTAGYTSATYNVSGSTNPRMSVLSSGLKNMLSILIEVAGDTSPLAFPRKDAVALYIATFNELFIWHQTNDALVRSTRATADADARQAGEDQLFYDFPFIPESFAGYELTETQFQTVALALEYSNIKWFVQRKNGLRFIPLAQPMRNFIPCVVGNSAGGAGDSFIAASRVTNHPSITNTPLYGNVELRKVGQAELDYYGFLTNTPHTIYDIDPANDYEWRVQTQRGGDSSGYSDWALLPDTGPATINSINTNNTGDQYQQVTATISGFAGDITGFTVGTANGVVVDGTVAGGTVTLRLPGDLATGNYVATLSNSTESATVNFAYTQTHQYTSPYGLVDSNSIFNGQVLTDNSFHRVAVPFANGTLDAAGAETNSLWGNDLNDIYAPDAGYSGTDTATFEILYADGTSAQWQASAVVPDEFAPIIDSVVLPANATYTLGQTLSLTVNWSEVVNVTGLPAININLNGVNRKARYASGTGTAATVFTYTIQQYDNASSGIALTSLTLDNGTIQDADLNNASLVFNNVGATAGVIVDTGPDDLVVIDSQVIGKTSATINFSYPGADVTGFEYNLDGGAWTSVTDPAQLSGLTSSTPYTFTIRPLNANGFGKSSSTTFVTGEAVDTTPSPYSFTALTNQALSTSVVSNTITVTGVDIGVDVPVSIAGDATSEYSVSTDGGTTFGGWASAATTVRLNYRVRVRHTTSNEYSSGIYDGDRVTTLDVGGVTASFVSSTIADNVKPGIVLTDGNIDWPRGVPFVDPGYIATDNADGVLPESSIEVIGVIDVNIPAPQSLLYRATDLSGNVTEVTRIVTVIDDGSTNAVFLLSPQRIKLSLS